MARRRKNRRKRIQPEQVELSIDGLSHDGRGLSSRNGKRVFVRGALPKENVLAEINGKRAGYDEGLTLEVHNPAPERVEPRCDYAGICGGCSLQHMDSKTQVQLKQSVLVEQLKHFGGIENTLILPPLVARNFNYRRKARLGVRYIGKRDEVLVGFREKGSSFITNMSQCHVLDERVGQLITPLRELIRSLAAYRSIPQIEVAMGDAETALVFRHLEPLIETDTQALTAFAEQHDVHLYLQPSGVGSVHKVWPEDDDLRLSYQLEEFGLEMRFHPMDFTQVNAEINKKMVSRALAWLEPQPGDRILDLFCGLGNFTLPLARSGAEVVGVEGNDAMVERGYENARLNELDNVSFFAADLTQEFKDQPWAKGGFDKILIDPPRSGALEIMQNIKHFQARTIVYVSCNPATLARDAGELLKQGYQIECAGVMDMFPHTAHVESMAVFSRV